MNMLEELPYWKSLEQLDAIARRAETTWGIGGLELRVSDDLREKFKRQYEKLNAAIENGNPSDIMSMAAGAMRGWAAMEAAVKAAGHVPPVPAYWDVTHGGKAYRVVRNTVDTGLDSVTCPDVFVVSVDELIGQYAAVREMVYDGESKSPDIKSLPTSFFRSGGDELGF